MFLKIVLAIFTMSCIGFIYNMGYAEGLKDGKRKKGEK